jgi:type I restriction enzyme S subunit
MEERELPVGWVEVDLCEVCTKIVDGSHNPPKASLSGLPMLSARNIESRGISLNADYRLIELDSFEVENRRTQIAKGDVLLTIVGAIGRTAVVSEELLPFTLQRSVAVLKPSPGIASRYLAYALESPSSQKYLLDNAKGTAQKGIYLKTLGGLSLHLSPSEEQRRIAAKLDTTLAAVEACRQRLDGVAAILKRFRQAVLAAATSGELTREWRGERGITTDSWAQATIIEISEQVFDGPFGSNLKSEDYTSEGFRVVRLENISHLHFLEEKRTFVSSAKFALLQKHVLFEDDILFSSFVEEDVRACLLPSALSGMSINKADCFCIRVNRELCLPGFVVSVLSCRSTFQSLDGLVHGATRPRINLKQLKSLSIALPPLQEQFEILRRQEQLFTLADQLEARHHAARKVVDRLTPALLAKAFRGELEPQDPSDEPASVLLERIRAARQAEAGAGKPSRRGRPKAAANPEPINRNAAPAPSEPLPPDLLTQLLRECGALSERALLAVSELEPEQFEQQLFRELEKGTAREVQANGQVLLEAVG